MSRIANICPMVRTSGIPNCAVLDGLGLSQSVPLATPCPHCPSHPTVPWERMDGLGYIPKCPIGYTLSIPPHCTMGKIVIVPKCPTCKTLSIPFHPITSTVPWELKDRQTPTVSHSLHPVHPIPLNHGKEQTDWDCTKVSHLLYTLSPLSIPLYHGMDR